MCVSKHGNILKLYEKTVIEGIFRSTFIFSSHEETVVEEDISYFERIHDACKLYPVTIVDVDEQLFLVHDFILEVTESS